MIDQTLYVAQILSDLNQRLISTARVEREMEIASGYLWKVRMGRKTLSEENLSKLGALHALYVKVKEEKPVIVSSSIPINKTLSPKKAQPKIIEVKEKKVMPKGLSISDQLKWRMENE